MPRTADRKMDRVIGARIRQLRIERSMTQETLGKEVGVAFQQIQKYEKGTNAIASNRISALCKALGVTPDDLYRLDLAGAKPPVALSNFAVRVAIKVDKLSLAQKRVVSSLLTSFLGDGDDDADDE